MAGTLIGALETATFEPDVVLIEANPLRTFELIHASIFETGGKFVTEFSAPHAICGYATVRPYLAGRLTTVIACNMARTVADSVGDAYLPEGLITGIPFEMLDSVIRNLGRLGSVRKRLAG